MMSWLKISITNFRNLDELKAKCRKESSWSVRKKKSTDDAAEACRTDLAAENAEIVVDRHASRNVEDEVHRAMNWIHMGYHATPGVSLLKYLNHYSTRITSKKWSFTNNMSLTLTNVKLTHISCCYCWSDSTPEEEIQKEINNDLAKCLSVQTYKRDITSFKINSSFTWNVKHDIHYRRKLL